MICKTKNTMKYEGTPADNNQVFFLQRLCRQRQTKEDFKSTNLRMLTEKMRSLHVDVQV